MAGKNYYLILGVSRSESLAGIRARYRDLVRTLHPDVAGAQSAGAFREVIAGRGAVGSGGAFWHTRRSSLPRL
jgi:DnaJ-class molecular chaperone